MDYYTMMQIAEDLFISAIGLTIGLGMLWFFFQLFILFRRLTDKSYNKGCQELKRLRYAGILLRVGMTEDEVRILLGEPDSIDDNDDWGVITTTWHYDLTAVVNFNEGKVVVWSGFRMYLWFLANYL